MSSTEDTNPSIAPASASPSEPQAAEHHIEREESAAPLSTPKLAIKSNMVAHKAVVKVSGARPGENPGAQDLFTEEATSLLVSEKGGVVELSAAVAPGQLLYLTNAESKRGVVAQVRRKRAFRPRTCFVELEFAEPAPRFWGIEFSAATALLPKGALDAETTALITAAEATTDEPSESPSAPTPEEIQTLKQKVETLRARMTSMQSRISSEQEPVIPPSSATTEPLEVPAAPAESLSSASASKDESAVAPVATLTTSVPLIERHSEPMDRTVTEQALLQKSGLDSAMLRRLPKRPRRARGSFTPGFLVGALRLALLTATLVITLLGAAWYKHWTPWRTAAKKPPISAPASSVSEDTSNPPRIDRVSSAESRSNDTGAVAQAPKTPPDKPSAITSQPHTVTLNPEDQAHPSVQSSADTGSPPPARVRDIPPSATLAARQSTTSLSAKPVTDSTAGPAIDTAIIPPKLIKSVRAVATMDAVRDFESGSVVIDAVVGTTGQVQSMNVLSGPPSLRAAAMDALRQYRYEPATRNGQPVPAHVTVTIRFQFEP